MPNWTALVTLLSVLLYVSFGLRVALGRRTYGVPVPATTGNPAFERLFRAQMNTLEWMPIYLPLLWLFAIYVGDASAAVIGLVWCLGRFLYQRGYAEAAEKRETGFRVQAAACVVLLLGDLVAILARIAHGG